MDDSQREDLYEKALGRIWMRQKKYSQSEDYEVDFKYLDSEFHRILIDSVHRHNLMELMAEHMIHIARWRNFDVTFAEPSTRIDSGA